MPRFFSLLSSVVQHLCWLTSESHDEKLEATSISDFLCNEGKGVPQFVYMRCANRERWIQAATAQEGQQSRKEEWSRRPSFGLPLIRLVSIHERGTTWGTKINIKLVLLQYLVN